MINEKNKKLIGLGILVVFFAVYASLGIYLRGLSEFLNNFLNKLLIVGVPVGIYMFVEEMVLKYFSGKSLMKTNWGPYILFFPIGLFVDGTKTPGFLGSFFALSEYAAVVCVLSLVLAPKILGSLKSYALPIIGANIAAFAVSALYLFLLDQFALLA